MKKLTILSILVISFSVILVYSCKKTGEARETRQEFMEDDIFRGIMFNEGKIASLIPQLQANQVRPEDIFNNRRMFKRYTT